MRRMRVGLAGLALLALLAGVCSCKKQEIIVCGPTVFLYYGNTASEAVGKLEAEQNKPRKELAKKYETDAVLTDFLELNVLPAPKDGLFKGIPMDYEVGEFCLEMTLVSSQRHHFEVHYNYYQAELKLPGETEGEEVDFNCGIRYTFYRALIYRNQIIDTVEEYERLYADVAPLLQGATVERIDGNLYVRHPEQEIMIFDLNPGIGILEVGKRGNASVTIPYEVMLPLCQWELIPVNNTGWENMTDWAGWW